MKDDLLIRDMQLSDRNFILKSILSHYKHGSPHTKLIPEHIFFDAHHYIISKAMRQDGFFCRMAALKDDPDVVFGFILGNFDPETIHYMYVKKAFRRMGMARHLVESAFDPNSDIYFTHLTFDAGFITRTHQNFVFNPYLLNGDVWRLTQAEGAADRQRV